MKKFFRNCLIAVVILIASGAILIVIASIWGGSVTWDKIKYHISERIPIHREKSLNVRESIESSGEDMLDSTLSAISEASVMNDLYTSDMANIYNEAYEIHTGNFDKQAISSGQVTKLQLKVGNCELYIENSNDDKCYLEVEEGDKFQFYQDGETLYVKALDSRTITDRWWDFDTWDAKLRLWLPKGVTYQEMYLEVGAGTAEIDELSAQNLTLKAGAGNIKAQHIAAETMQMEIGAGAVKAERIQAEYLNTKVGAGSAKIEQMEVKDLEAQADAGSFQGEGKITGNAILNCSVGSIDMELDGNPEDYNYNITCALGSVRIGSEKYSGIDTDSQIIDNGSGKRMDINCNVGAVKIKF